MEIYSRIPCLKRLLWSKNRNNYTVSSPASFLCPGLWCMMFCAYMQNVIVHTLCGTQSFANTQCILLWQPRFIGLHRTLAALIVLHCIIACLYLMFWSRSWCWFVLSFIASKCWILSILVLEIRCIKWLNGINFCFISTAWERILNCWIALKQKTKKSLYLGLLFSYLMTICCVECYHQSLKTDN